MPDLVVRFYLYFVVQQRCVFGAVGSRVTPQQTERSGVSVWHEVFDSQFGFSFRWPRRELYFFGPSIKQLAHIDADVVNAPRKRLYHRRHR